MKLIIDMPALAGSDLVAIKAALVADVEERSRKKGRLIPSWGNRAAAVGSHSGVQARVHLTWLHDYQEHSARVTGIEMLTDRDVEIEKLRAELTRERLSHQLDVQRARRRGR